MYRSKVCDLMVLDISQAGWTVSISQLQNKMCPLKGRLLKPPHFIAVSRQEYACGHWDHVTLSFLMNCTFLKMENSNRGNQALYFNKETGFFFPPDLTGRGGKGRDFDKIFFVS